ncbi:uncharacterized protein LACBIDRAFT_304057 [Laccaria bicolor S238N-H82]|uniref:Predicted protein n=1 Tax=Laccaria bicolor (strain S238N-H82 / ATCC MYA-4686) TaxID=486041 RepID=B0DKV3_LACBS|nr:uncharacterized protein LACBIDRAFT_304057 [Laccaria bicolor S238N-H82]EDR04711.1 predicted protein [Laccaria bicolor S238N-H82]|eukprot:XP_001884535.1 predicted protein [Laccaria bicolor S238N-H82]
MNVEETKEKGWPGDYWVITQAEGYSTRLAMRSLDGVVDEESAEETEGDKEVIEEGAEEVIPGTGEVNNQELEGDCVLVKHLLGITLITHLYLQKYQHPEQGDKVGLEPWSKCQDELICADFGCEQAVSALLLTRCNFFYHLTCCGLLE